MVQVPEDVSKTLNEILAHEWVGNIFSGWYSDRILCDDSSQMYKDRILIDEAETDVSKKAKSLHRRLRKLMGEDKYCGVSKSDGGSFCLLVDWGPSVQQSFGHFWFFIEDAHFHLHSGITWQIRVIRSVLSSDEEGITGKCPHCKKHPNDSSINSTDDPLSMSEIYSQLLDKVYDNLQPGDWIRDVRPYLSVSNLVSTVKFLVVFLMAAITGLVNLIPQILHQLNNTILALSTLIKQSQPFMVGCLEMVTKIVGGFYLLIAMIWRDARQPSAKGRPPVSGMERNYLPLEGPNNLSPRHGQNRPYVPR